MTNKEAIEQLKQMPINPEASYEYMKTIYVILIIFAQEVRRERLTEKYLFYLLFL